MKNVVGLVGLRLVMAVLGGRLGSFRGLLAVFSVWVMGYFGWVVSSC